MAANPSVPPLIELDRVSRRFVKRLDLAGKIAQRLGVRVREQTVVAADNVRFTVAEGEVVGLVGESDCGKTTVGRMVAGILEPIMELREAIRLTYLFITHDIGMVRQVATRVVVMYLGRVVEMGRTEAVLGAPRHPCTQILLQQVPRLSQRRTRFTPIQGEIPSPLQDRWFHSDLDKGVRA